MSNRELVLRLTKEGKSAKQITEITGLSKGAVQYHRSERRRQSNIKRIAEHRRKMKLKAIEYKGGKCKKCGYNRCANAMSFHHLDPAQKDFKISCGRTWSWEKIKKELDKTIMFCNRCHAELHAGLWVFEN